MNLNSYAGPVLSSFAELMIILEWDNCTYLFTYYCYYFLLLAVPAEEIRFDTNLIYIYKKTVCSLKIIMTKLKYVDGVSQITLFSDIAFLENYHF